MNVFLSKLAESKLLKLSDFLIEKWNLQVHNEFLEKFTEKVLQISKHPKSCPKSMTHKKIYKCVVSKQTTFYYRISKNEIEIITIFDTRQHPRKLDKDVK